MHMYTKYKVSMFNPVAGGGAQGNKMYTFIFLNRPEHYNQQVLSHSFICLLLPYMERIVLIYKIDLYCVIAIFNGTGDKFKR